MVDGGVREAEQPAEQQDRSAPIVTIALLVCIVAIFLAMFIVGHGNIHSVALQFGEKDSELIHAGQWQRLITPIFLHGTWEHLIVNGLSLFWFGTQIERIYGGRKFFLIYMASGIAGNMLSYLMSPNPSLGASGALFGLIGAGIIFPLRFRRLMAVNEREAILKQLVVVAAINLALSFSPGIDRYAHFGGLIGGGIMALFLLPEVLDERPRNRVREGALTVVAVLTLGIVVVAAGKQWSAARSELRGTSIVYSPAGLDAWWHFELPDTWKPVKLQEAGAVWIGPQNARITVVDSVADADLFEQTERWRAEHEVETTSLAVGGQQATMNTVRANGLVTQVCQVFAFGRTVDIGLVCSQAGYPIAESDYLALLGSVQFNRRPVAR